MDDAPLVGVVNAAGDGDDELDTFRQCGPAASRGRAALFLQPLRQALSVDELHAEVMLSFPLADFVNGNDGWMVQIGGGLGFGAEAGDVVGGGQFP